MIIPFIDIQSRTAQADFNPNFFNVNCICLLYFHILMLVIWLSYFYSYSVLSEKCFSETSFLPAFGAIATGDRPWPLPPPAIHRRPTCHPLALHPSYSLPIPRLESLSLPISVSIALRLFNYLRRSSVLPIKSFKSSLICRFRSTFPNFILLLVELSRFIS